VTIRGEPEIGVWIHFSSGFEKMNEKTRCEEIPFIDSKGKYY